MQSEFKKQRKTLGFSTCSVKYFKNETSICDYIYSKINIVSGDGFFSSIVNWLKNKKFNLNIYGQLEVSHHELANDLNFIPLSKSNLVLPKI